MSLSRGTTVLRQATTICRPGGATVQQVRNSGGLYSYRTGAYPPNNLQRYGSVTAMAIAWWWMFHNIFTQPEHILGEFDYPDPKKWTDAELGIPPDDVD